MDSKRPEAPRPADGGRRCLRCYACLTPGELGRPRASEVCPACGTINVLADRQVYWTREPWLVQLELGLKAVSVVVALLLIALMTTIVPHGGTGAGWALLIPVGLGVALWMTASKLTRHATYFQAAFVWQLVFLFFGGFFALMLPAAFNDRGASLGVEVGALVVAFVALAFSARWAGRRFERWKKARMRSSRTRLA